MVLNLKTRKRLPRWPTRSCRKRIGPGDASLIQSATSITTGKQKGRLRKMQVISRTRFHWGMAGQQVPVPVSVETVPAFGEGASAFACEAGSRQTRRWEADSSANGPEGSVLASTVCIVVQLGSQKSRHFEPVKVISDRDSGQLRDINRPIENDQSC